MLDIHERWLNLRLTAYKIAKEMEVKNIQQATKRLHLQPNLKNIINFVVYNASVRYILSIEAFDQIKDPSSDY